MTASRRQSPSAQRTPATIGGAACGIGIVISIGVIVIAVEARP